MTGSGHIDEDVLEQYSIGSLGDTEVAIIEEHLLICEDCRARLSQIDEFIASLGEAVEDE